MIRGTKNIIKELGYDEDLHGAGYVVYTITIGDLIYIGISGSFKRRIIAHKSAMEQIISDNRECLSCVYTKFKKNDILKHGYKFSIVGFYATEKEALGIEKEFILSYPSDKLLNNSRGTKSHGKKLYIWVKDKYAEAAAKDLLKIQNKYAKL